MKLSTFIDELEETSKNVDICYLSIEGGAIVGFEVVEASEDNPYFYLNDDEKMVICTQGKKLRFLTRGIDYLSYKYKDDYKSFIKFDVELSEKIRELYVKVHISDDNYENNGDDELIESTPTIKELIKQLKELDGDLYVDLQQAINFFKLDIGYWDGRYKIYEKETDTITICSDNYKITCIGYNTIEYIWSILEESPGMEIADLIEKYFVFIGTNSEKVIRDIEDAVADYYVYNY
jgi:hypothetical protein